MKNLTALWVGYHYTLYCAEDYNDWQLRGFCVVPPQKGLFVWTSLLTSAVPWEWIAYCNWKNNQPKKPQVLLAAITQQ